MGESYFARGLGLREEVKDQLARDYHSILVDRLRSSGFTMTVGDTTIRLAEEFGFCYGVERAVDYAYQTRERFPDRDVFITGEIIHNPGVNERLRTMRIRFLDGSDGAPAHPRAADVVILPAFGVPLKMMEEFKTLGCVLVDTTCGSVLNVWKNVENYARDGFTSIIHGKYQHEETRATASRALRYPGGRYLVVRDLEQAEIVCEYIRGRGDRERFLATFDQAASPGFDPDRDLEHVGVANQTTMLSSESLRIAGMIREAMVERHGEQGNESRFRSFDTICSATQDRQDAVKKLVEGGVGIMIVIGGYNSSNTNHLAEMSAASVPTYHVAGAACFLSCETIRHKPLDLPDEIETRGWLPSGPLVIGLTAGASTPNNEIGATISRLLELRGHDVPTDQTQAGS
jgi:4-hydroxy-3-methylbut-2-enyl diphosphate reductase